MTKFSNAVRLVPGFIDIFFHSCSLWEGVILIGGLRMAQDEVVTPEGTRIWIAASSGDVPCRANLPESSDKIEPISSSWLKKKYSCGHRGPRKFSLFVHGISVDSTKHNDLCPECLIEEVKRTVIRCGFCGLPIFPGDGVALYHPTTQGLDLAIASFVDPDSVMCCMRWDCSPHSSFLFAGHWTKDGFRQFSFGDHD